MVPVMKKSGKVRICIDLKYQILLEEESGADIYYTIWALLLPVVAIWHHFSITHFHAKDVTAV